MINKISILVLVLTIILCASPWLQAEDTRDSQGIVTIDPRIELYIVTAYLSDSFFKRWLNTNVPEYLNDIEQYFSTYKTHKVVTFFEQTWKKDMSNYIPPEVMIYLSGKLEKQEDLPIPQDIINHIGGRQKTDEFLSFIKDFYFTTNFVSFFNAHKDFYETLISPVRELIRTNNCVSNLAEYYGSDKNSYTILLVPLLGVGNGYGPSLPSKEGQRDIYCLLSPLQNESQILNLIWHEFSHSFVDPVVHKNLEKINKYKSLYAPISSDMKPLYEDWEACLSEHLVRTITSRIFLKTSRETEALQQVASHTSQKFLYIEPLYEKLEEYEKKRKKYETFEEYFPNILNVLKKLSKSTQSNNTSTKMFKGPLNSISKDIKYIIIPTNEANDQIEDQIKKYTEAILEFLQKRNKFERFIIKDQQALDMDLSNENLFVYGTLSGNLWLKKHAKELPFSIEADKIIADKTYSGKNLRFLTAWPNFENKAKGVIIYTAQRAEDIVGINGVFHGPTDFIIFENGDQVLVSGNYDKTSPQWSFSKKK